MKEGPMYEIFFTYGVAGLMALFLCVLAISAYLSRDS
jgi:hypothetical protein